MDIYLHCYCFGSYASILYNKYKKINSSELLKNIDNFYVIVSNVQERHKDFLQKFSTLSNKIKIIHLLNPVFNDESDTLNFILYKSNDSLTNRRILYLHTKGVTHSHPLAKKNVDAWVEYLDLYNIHKWKECVDALDTNDVAGGLYESSNPKHFSGNFWWANTNYIKTLPEITEKNYKLFNRGEFWILSNTDKIYPVSENSTIDRYQNLVFDQKDFPSYF
jgi:hypothetical protein